MKQRPPCPVPLALQQKPGETLCPHNEPYVTARIVHGTPEAANSNCLDNLIVIDPRSLPDSGTPARVDWKNVICVFAADAANSTFASFRAAQ
ncbi:hypothetical protein MESS4_280113 [Mesorhizobium sp. STM 4661]|nr:hypothetical protein MESS4_280113 [Mesorhizobium sp. STM 4661]